MAQQHVEHVRRMALESVVREQDGGLSEPNNTRKIPLANRKAGRATKKETRCRFCAPGKLFTSSLLARHTMLTHERAIRSLDNPAGSATMFKIGHSIGGQKGSYLQHRAFYNLLKYSGAIQELPGWTGLGKLKWDTDIEQVAVGNPIVDNTGLIETEEIADDPVVHPPTPVLGEDEQFFDTGWVAENAGPLFEQDTLLDDPETETHE